MKHAYISLILAGSLAACAPVTKISQPDIQAQRQEEQRQRVLVLRKQLADEARVNGLLLILGTKSGNVCRKASHATGLSLVSIDYAKPDYQAVAAAYLGWNDRVVVASVVNGSAGDGAGIRAGDEIKRINKTGDLIGAGALDKALRELAQAGGSGSPLDMQIFRDGQTHTLTLYPSPACTNTAVIHNGVEPFATVDGETVIVPTSLLRYTKTDGELAAALAFGLSQVWSKQRTDDSILTFFASKDLEALDRRALQAMANAGFDPAAALTYWTRLATESEYLRRISRKWEPNLVSDERLANLEMIVQELSLRAQRLN